MEENMNQKHALQCGLCDFMDFMGVGEQTQVRAQHGDDEIGPVEHELDPEQETMDVDSGRSSYNFIDFMGFGAQNDGYINDPQTWYQIKIFGTILLQIARKNSTEKSMNLDRGRSSYCLIDFMGLGAEYDDHVDIEDVIPQGHDPAQVHHHQKDSTWSDVDSNALVEEGEPMELELPPTGKVERTCPKDRKVRLDLDLCLLPHSSMRLLREEGPHILTLQLGPTSDPTSEPALDPGSL